MLKFPERAVHHHFYHPTVGDAFYSPMILEAMKELTEALEPHKGDTCRLEGRRFEASNGVVITFTNETGEL